MMSLSAYELEDLQQAMMERMEESLLPAISRANRTGELSDLLRLLGMDDLAGDDGAVDMHPTRIIVMGDSMVKESKLRSLARKHGFDPSLFDFALGYDQLKHYDFAKLRGTFTYRAVLVGPMPHSTSGKRSASSAIAEMQSHPETYPPVVELRDSTGLKITNNSFAKGLNELSAIA
ncbi:hypothetical protein [Slackia exigua]|uniref:hypothetical protein n=1 Tax=Slackia exigua TaxID=84109 RepID=UPI0028D6DE61|nr:hypothetical protein [Slackia exigua]